MLQNPRNMLPCISRFRSLKAYHHHHHLHKFPIFPPLSLASFSTSTPKISSEGASSVSSSAFTKYINNPKNADSVLNFLKETGFLKSQVEAVVQKLPKLLSADLEKTGKPKIKVFQDLGFHSSDFADIISTSPWLLTTCSADRLWLSILGLKNVLGPNANMCIFLKKSGSATALMSDWERTLVPNIEYLKSCGICSLQIASYVCRNLWVFQTKLENLKGCVQKVDEMGVERKSKVFLRAVRVMSCLSRGAWEHQLKFFRDLGFSEQNVLRAFRYVLKHFLYQI